MSNPENYLATLKKKAEGFTADEVVEEYSADADGNLALTKRKVTSKYYPPDTAALKSVLEYDEYSELTDDELECEKRRLLQLLAAAQTESEEQNER
jgi:hypothetical protein